VPASSRRYQAFAAGRCALPWMAVVTWPRMAAASLALIDFLAERGTVTAAELREHGPPDAAAILGHVAAMRRRAR
jgi:hypothetical protein